MLRTTLSNGASVSVMGIGGHYRHMEFGRYEATRAPIEDAEVESRARLIERAVEGGITYFDTTWHNELDMLARTLRMTGLRDRVHINGMVLGTFPGSAHEGMGDAEYVERHLDERLALLPDHRFDSFMINAIEEQYDRRRCEALLPALQRRKAAGDIGMIGFSCHDHALAREIADDFPEFELVMTAYNHHNRAFERAFDGYAGDASFVAMKPLVWAQYGLSVAALNRIGDFEGNLGFAPDERVAERALRFPRASGRVAVTVAAVNSESELDALLCAGEGAFDEDDARILGRYEQAMRRDDGIPLFIGGMRSGNPRAAFFGIGNLLDALGMDRSGFSIAGDDRYDVIETHRRAVEARLREGPYARYL